MDHILHLVAFCHNEVMMGSYTQWLSIVEINYEVHGKELLAIVHSLEQWPNFLKGSPHQIIVFSDHKTSHNSKEVVTVLN